jgi:hypothetical protein
MKRMLAIAFAGALGLGCSSGGSAGAQGAVGPTGPTGPTGLRGDTGSQGQPGVSVLSAQLAVGSASCPNGGGQFTSASGTTFACNGLPGAKGDPGTSARTVVAKAGTTTIGPAYPLAPLSNGSNVLGVYVAPGAFVMLDPETGRSVLTGYVYFVQPECTGVAYLLAGNTSPVNAGRPYAVEAIGTTRVVRPYGPGHHRCLLPVPA